MSVLELFRLDKKVALVTGVGRGLGQAMALGLAEAGADIAGLYLANFEETQAQVEALGRRFPNLNTIAITLRGSLSASHNTWSAVLWHRGEIHTAPRYDIIPIVDRVGGGDSFCGGLIYGLRAYDDVQHALHFAVAASCLKHTVPGDFFNLVSVAEVEKLMGGDVSGRVSR